MSFRIRAASAADVPAMHRIRLAVQENRLSGPRSIDEASYLPYVDAGAAWLAETQAGVVGFAVVDLEKRSIWALFVAPEAEGMGVGRSLHRRLLDRAREKGVPQLWLSTAKGTRAERFYKQAGWQEAGIDGDQEVRLTTWLGA